MPFVLLYDADCGPCTRFKNSVKFLDASRRIESIPLTEGDRKGLLERVPPSLRHRSFHLVSPDGAVLSGAKALPQLLALLPAGRIASRLIVGAPGGVSTMAFVYTVFSRLHSTGSCSYVPGKENHSVPRFVPHESHSLQGALTQIPPPLL
jgi:predicted DCC family thiol-disulfide oxidoreductase YuxK